MIVGLRGLLVLKEPTLIHLDVQGVIYEIFVSLHTSTAIDSKELQLHITHIIREDAQLLFGFSSKSEKQLFNRLIKINGVGPKVALAICSTYSPEQFGQIISSGDLNALKKVPGIGPKSAGRILVELNGFDVVLLESGSSVMSQNSEASLALESLGFKKEQINKVLNLCSATDTASLVKEALKKLQKI